MTAAHYLCRRMCVARQAVHACTRQSSEASCEPADSHSQMLMHMMAGGIIANVWRQTELIQHEAVNCVHCQIATHRITPVNDPASGGCSKLAKAHVAAEMAYFSLVK